MQLNDIFNNKNKKFLYIKLMDNSILIDFLKILKENNRWYSIQELTNLLNIKEINLIKLIKKEKYNDINRKNLAYFKILEFKKDGNSLKTLYIKYNSTIYDEIIDSCIKRNDLLKDNKWVEKWKTPTIWD